MSRVGDLIAELCPDGVPFRHLGEIAVYSDTRVPATTVDQDSFVGVDNLLPNQGGRVPSDYVPSTGSLTEYRAGDVLIGNIRPYLKKIWLATNDGGCSGDVLALRIRDSHKQAIIPAFLYRVLSTDAFFTFDMRHSKGGKMPRGSKAMILKYPVPLPPLKVQEEVVRVLNTFTELEAKLVAELEARKEQRSALAQILPGSERIRALSPHGLEHVRIGEVATQSVVPVQVEPDETYVNLGVKWYGEGVFARGARAGSAIKGSTLYRVKPGQFIYNRMFVVEGSFGIITPELADGVVSNEFPVYDLDNTRILPGWLMLVLLNEYTLKCIAAEVTGVERGPMKGRRRWKENQFEAFQIELPSIVAQREVLRALDASAALESALSDELDARHNQYAHYCDRLLTFKEAA